MAQPILITKETIAQQRGMPKVNLPKPATVPTSKAPPTSGLPVKPMSWQDKLASYQSNPESAQTELKRAQDKANLQQATGDTKGYDASTHWINQINTAIGPQPDPQVKQFNEYQQKQKELMSKFEGMMNQPTTYNPEADPRYQAYKTLYEKQAAKASQSAMETMNERGILNSTVTSDRLGQIQQEAQGNALAAVPEFYAQDQQAQQDRLRNAGELLGFVTDEARNAQDVGYRNKAFDRGVLESDRSFDFQKIQQEWDNTFREGQFDFQKANTLWEQNFKNKSFQQGVNEFAQQMGLQYNQLNQSGQEFLAEMAYKNEALALNKDELAQRKFQDEVANEFKSRELDFMEKEANQPAGLQAKDSTDNYYSAINIIKGSSKADAITYIQNPEVRSQLSDADYKKALAYIEENIRK